MIFYNKNIITVIIIRACFKYRLGPQNLRTATGLTLSVFFILYFVLNFFIYLQYLIFYTVFCSLCCSSASALEIARVCETENWR